MGTCKFGTENWHISILESLIPRSMEFEQFACKAEKWRRQLLHKLMLTHSLLMRIYNELHEMVRDLSYPKTQALAIAHSTTVIMDALQ